MHLARRRAQGLLRPAVCRGAPLPRASPPLARSPPAGGKAVSSLHRPAPQPRWRPEQVRAAASSGAGAGSPVELPPLVDQVMRGVGQVVFCNSPASGALITAGLCCADPRLAAFALVGCTSATLTARFAGMSADAIRNGLLGYNGALVGCAFSVFLGAAAEPTLAATALGGAASAVLAGRLGPMTAPVPQWTLAFNAMALALLVFVRPLAPSPADETLADEAPKCCCDAFGAEDYAASALTGVSQIFVVNSPAAGLLMLAGVAAYSPGAAAATLLGSCIGVASGALAGASAADVRNGLWGFNPALTSLAVSIFFAPSPVAPPLALACGGALATSAVTVGMKAALAGAFQVPALTLPFCAVATGCYLLGGRAPGLALSAAAHSPEENLRVLRAAAGAR